MPSSTLYRWRARYAKYGMRGLVDESRARKTLPQRTARTAAAVELVLSLREEAPWGKAIMAEVLRRMGVGISASSAGRIIAELLAKGRIARAGAGQWGNAGRRFKRVWARRQRGKPEETPGRIQMDTLKVSNNAGRVVVFTARCVRSGVSWTMAAANGTAASAKRFLLYIKERAPFPITHIQVDGGSEFKAEFEECCQAVNIPLLVIPPRSPRHNGKIENFNGTLRREVFNFRSDFDMTVADVQRALDDFTRRYNHERPNMALPYRDDDNRLRYRTPLEYTQSFISHGKHNPPEIPI